MPSLVLLLESCERHVYPLGQATLIVGRNDDSNVHLPSESVSNNHASIVFDNGNFILRDNGSTNGSYVNDQLVKNHVLQHYDIVRFGDYRFLVNLRDEVSLSSQRPVSTKKGEYGQEQLLPTTQKDKKTSSSRILLTKPIQSGKVSKKAYGVIPGVGASKKYGGLKKIGFFISTVLVTTFLVIFYSPFIAREAVVESENFKKIPLHQFLEKLFIRKDVSNPSSQILSDGLSFNVKFKLPKTGRISGKLQLSQKVDLPIRIKVKIVSSNNQIVTDHVLDVSPDQNEISLFSTVIPQGDYQLEYSCEGIVSPTGIPATLFVSNQI